MTKSIHLPQYHALVECLRQFREEAGMTQTQLASKMGVHQSFVSKYESAERRLDLIELGQIANALGVPLSSIIKELEKRTDEAR